ncbi:hypothetical protein [Rhizobium sp. BR 314]|uniref:hypothetical protein n=1 Tax=Rhizobium sp. BR 314 TaxID=3040013 RepID=UPI0039BF601B
MGELPLWHKQKSGIGAAGLPVRLENLCLSREVVNPAMLDLTLRDAHESDGSVVRYDIGRSNAGLDTIASYARNCGKRLRLSVTGSLLSGSASVSCAIRENIRETDGGDAIAVMGPNGAKEIDCYV